jgi:hypothetical protein
MSETLHFTLFEKILILAGLFFFANVIYLASGGDFSFLYIAKGIYLIGIVILATEL